MRLGLHYPGLFRVVGDVWFIPRSLTWPGFGDSQPTMTQTARLVTCIKPRTKKRSARCKQLVHGSDNEKSVARLAGQSDRELTNYLPHHKPYLP